MTEILGQFNVERRTVGHSKSEIRNFRRMREGRKIRENGHRSKKILICNKDESGVA